MNNRRRFFPPPPQGEYPILALGNPSYLEGQYEPSVESRETSVGQTQFIIHHKVTNADCILEWIAAGRAAYHTLICSRTNAQTEVLQSSNAQQTAILDPNRLMQSPILYPSIIATESFHMLWTEEHPVDPLWHGRQTFIEAGAKLAVALPYQEVADSLISLVHIRPAPELDKPKQPQLTAYVADDEDIRIRVIVRLHPQLHAVAQLQTHDSQMRPALSTLIAAAALAAVRDRYTAQNRDQWQNRTELRALLDDLKEKGFPPWDSPDFEPAAAATMYARFPCNDTKILENPDAE